MTKTITCEHGTQTIPDFTIAWNGPISKCGCCGRSFTHLNHGSIGAEGGSSTYWYPMDRCSTCGGKYIEHQWTKWCGELAKDSNIKPIVIGFSNNPAIPSIRYTHELQNLDLPKPVDIHLRYWLPKNGFYATKYFRGRFIHQHKGRNRRQHGHKFKPAWLHKVLTDCWPISIDLADNPATLAGMTPNQNHRTYNCTFEYQRVELR